MKEKETGPRPVLIQMTSEQWTNGVVLPAIQLTTEGLLRRGQGHWSIHYSESEATGMEGTETEITLDDDGTISLVRSGSVEMEMEFRTGQNHRSQVLLDHGMVGFHLMTNEARGELNARGGHLYVSYSLDFDHEDVISTKLELSVTALRGGAFRSNRRLISD